MSTIFDLNDTSKRYSHTGYEGQNNADYIIPSCGVEDLDKAVFNLFDKQIPLYFDLHGEKRRVPVVFATGERFALLRRKKPLVDRNGALILPLISITRNSIDAVPQKGIANNQMFPHVITKRISKKDLEYRQIKNFENLNNIDGLNLENDSEITLEPSINKNIIETIEMPAVKYFSAQYEISLWSSFTQQANKFIEAIMSSYTLNPGQQFRIESDKGYYFSAFLDSQISQDTNYSDFTDAERYIKFNISLSATGYIIAPNILGGKTALKSFLSSPTVSFDVLPIENNQDIINTLDTKEGIISNDPDSNILNDILTNDSSRVTQQIGLNNISALQDLIESNNSNIDKNSTKSDSVAQRDSISNRSRKSFIYDEKENKYIPVMSKQTAKGETVYDEKYMNIIFDLNKNK
jgi:hypothetical protein